MENYLTTPPREDGRKNRLLIGAAIGTVVLAAVIGLLMLRPSMKDQMAAILDGSYREGSPEFNAISRDIVMWTGENTTQSPNGFGKISMFISGRIRNKGNRVITVLEVSCAVITQFNEVLKEKRILVVPTKQERLSPGQTIEITTQIDGFDKSDDRANIRWKVTAIGVEN